MEDLIAELERKIVRNRRWDKDIPFLKDTHAALASHMKNIRLALESSDVWGPKSIQAILIMRGVSEINGGALSSLEFGNLSAVETLFRVSLEHSINMIYIFDEEEVTRSRAFLRGAIESIEDKARKRKNRAERMSDALDHFGASNKMDFAEMLRKENPKLFKDKSLRWPSAFDRFSACGKEKEYRNLYSTASDTVHSLSEDILNRIISTNLPPKLRPTFLTEIETYRKSLSIYFLLQSFRIWVEALSSAGRRVSYGGVSSLADLEERILERIMEHEAECINREQRGAC